MKDVELIFGPPGTGKTRTLMDVIDREIENGTDPKKIAFVSFTRKAAHEAVTRAVSRFNLDADNLDNFRTLHSMAYYHLGLNRNDVMTRQHWQELGEILGVRFTGIVPIEEGLPAGSEKGDKMLQLLALARNRQTTLKQQFVLLPELDIDWHDLQLFQGTLAAYKREKCLWDYSDFLERFHQECNPLNVDIAIIDEAQDLSNLQWKMARHAFKDTKRIRIAMDDDQAIFNWAGADTRTALNIKGNKRILNKSYRLPRSVWKVADSVTQQIKHRQDKTWAPKDIDGAVYRVRDINDIDYSKGSWLVLARNVHFLTKYKELFDAIGYSYTYRRNSSIKLEHILAIYSWQKLLKGDDITAEQASAIFTAITIRKGLAVGARRVKFDLPTYSFSQLKELGLYTDKPWFESLTAIPLIQREYYRACLRNGENLRETPRIHIDTIHGVKGGEADNVVLMTDISWRTHKEYKKQPDDEHRVFYVGLTRTKNTLYIVDPTTNYWYDGIN